MDEKVSVTCVPLVEAAADFSDVVNDRYFQLQVGNRIIDGTITVDQFVRLIMSLSSKNDGDLTNRAIKFVAQVAMQPICIRLLKTDRLPAWASNVGDLLITLESECHVSKMQVPKSRLCDDSRFFLLLCLPIVRWSVRRLKERCPPKLHRQLSSAAFQKLYASLATRLLQVITPAARLHFGLTSNRKQQQKKRSVSRSPSSELQLLELCYGCPVLARLVATIALDWQKNTIELFTRLHSDYCRLNRVDRKIKKSCSRRQPLVVDVDTDLSDFHHGGRTVMALRFRNGGRIIYKPRSCRGEKEWGRLLRCFDDPVLQSYQPRVLERGAYGWVEYVRRKPCRSYKEAHLFYQRAGALLLLAHLSKAVDLHRGNLIAVGPSPVVVDLETLSHPRFRESDFAGPPALYPLNRIGLLPSINRGQRMSESHALDSAITNDPTDKHRPLLNSKCLHASDFVTAIEQGFRRAALDLYRTPASRRRCAKILQRISTHQWRRILRPTAVYTDIRRTAIDPAFLGNGVNRQLALLKRCAAGNVPVSIAWAEAAALGRFDIPLFTGTTITSKRHLRDILPPLQQILAETTQIAKCWKRL